MPWRSEAAASLILPLPPVARQLGFPLLSENLPEADCFSKDPPFSTGGM